MLRRFLKRYLIMSGVLLVVAWIFGIGPSTYPFLMGVLYHEGLGVEQDYKEAATWFQEAADQGHPQAQAALGTLYAKGLGVAKSFDDSARWFREAAEQGLPEAQYSLGLLYAGGMGVPQDLVQARAWAGLAARQELSLADKLVPMLESRMTDAEIEAAGRLERDWIGGGSDT